MPLALLLVFALPLAAQNPRIAVGGIIHETNTFNPKKTTLADFETGLGGAHGILRGGAILQEHANSNSTIHGFIEGARKHGLDLVPTLLAGPQTIGTVTESAFETLTRELMQRIESSGKIDGILLALHGTMVSESHAHADAEVVRRLRQKFGNKIPIVVVHDFHANVSEEIVRYTDVLITYKECPHLDAKDRGYQAAKIMSDIVRGKVKPTQAIAKPPMLYNIIFHNTFALPLKPIVDQSKKIESNPRVLAASVPGGYQYADISAMGPSAIVVTDNDPDLAQREAKRLADMLYGLRPHLTFNLPDPAQAVRAAMNASKFPITLMDTGDNIGGGSAGDSTFVLAELIGQKAEGWVVVIADPEAAQTAFRAGVGGSFHAKVGGKTDTMHGQPVTIRGRVKSLLDGRFIEPAIRHGGGRYWDMGPTAVIEVDGSTRDLPNLLMLTPKRVIPFSLHQLTSAGIYPERQKILVAKGTVAPRAAYEPVSAQIIEVDSGGVTAVNPARFEFKRVRPNLFGMK